MKKQVPPRTTSIRRRVAAHLIDGVVLVFVGVGLAALVSAVLGPSAVIDDGSSGEVRLLLHPVRYPLQAAAGTLASGAYFTLLWAGPWQATIGQRLLRIRVVGARTQRSLPIGRGIVRWLLLGAPFGLLAAVTVESALWWTAVVVLAAAWSVVLLVSARRHPMRRGIHDRIAGSMVVS